MRLSGRHAHRPPQPDDAPGRGARLEHHFALPPRRADAFVTLDNRTYPVGEGASFTVHKAERPIFLAVPHNISFYDTLRNKMMWGIDIRS